MLHGRFDEVKAGEPGSLDVLLAALADRDAATKRGALGALTRLRDGRAASAVAALLRDPDAGVRDAAVEALVALGPAAADHIADALRDRAATARAAAERVVSGIGEAAFATALVARLSVGQQTTHAGRELRIVQTRAALDDVRRAGDLLDLVLARMAGMLAPAILQSIATLPDAMLIEPGQVPGDSDSVDHEPLRAAGAEELKKR
jgi:HEAT repeat protein